MPSISRVSLVVAFLVVASGGCVGGSGRADAGDSSAGSGGTAGADGNDAGGFGGGGTSGSTGADGGVSCDSVLCTTADCPSGTRAELLPGDCCPTCIRGEPDEALCNSARLGLLPAIMRDLGAAPFSCESDDECGIADLSSLCSYDCGHAANLSHVAELQQFARTYASERCSPCTVEPIACPDVEWTFVCTEGRCGLR